MSQPDITYSGIVIHYDDADAKQPPFVAEYSPDIETFVSVRRKSKKIVKKFPVSETYRDICDDLDISDWPQLKAKLDSDNVQKILAAAITYTRWCFVVRRAEGDLDEVYGEFPADQVDSEKE